MILQNIDDSYQKIFFKNFKSLPSHGSNKNFADPRLRIVDLNINLLRQGNKLFYYIHELVNFNIMLKKYTFDANFKQYSKKNNKHALFGELFSFGNKYLKNIKIMFYISI